MPAGLDAESIGPVDVAVIMFEGNEFNGEVAPAIADLDASGTVRIIDLAFVTKDAAGETAVIEIEDDAVASAFDRISDGQFDLLNDEDLDGLAADLEPGTSALIVVWENRWLARAAAAIRGSGGEVVWFDPFQDRAPTQ